MSRGCTARRGLPSFRRSEVVRNFSSLLFAQYPSSPWPPLPSRKRHWLPCPSSPSLARRHRCLRPWRGLTSGSRRATRTLFTLPTGTHACRDEGTHHHVPSRLTPTHTQGHLRPQLPAGRPPRVPDHARALRVRQPPPGRRGLPVRHVRGSGEALPRGLCVIPSFASHDGPLQYSVSVFPVGTYLQGANLPFNCAQPGTRRATTCTGA